MSEVVYFGVKSPTSKGHYFFKPGFQYDGLDHKQLRFGNDQHLDGGMLKAHKVPDVEGRAAYQQVNGYSVVSWWDRSGDSRGASNSAFIVQGVHSPQEVMYLGAEHFPTILHRQRRPIILPDGTVLMAEVQ